MKLKSTIIALSLLSTVAMANTGEFSFTLGGSVDDFSWSFLEQDYDSKTVESEEEIEIVNCRTAVVLANEELGRIITPNSFSTISYKDIKSQVPAEVFNIYDTISQVQLYNLLLPMSVTVENTIQAVNYRSFALQRLSTGAVPDHSEQAQQVQH